MPNRVHVKHLSGTLYDIFWGIGWDNWTRMSIIVSDTERTKFIHVKGLSLPFNARIATAKYLRV